MLDRAGATEMKVVRLAGVNKLLLITISYYYGGWSHLNWHCNVVALQCKQ